MTCPLCRQRKAKRFCPAEGQTICAVCCGTYREVTIDCPFDCPHLVAARRYEREHRQPLPPERLPYPEMRVSLDRIERQQDLVVLLGRTLLDAAREPRSTDADALQAIAALAETYRTLQAGIYYEAAPAGALARDLYSRLAGSLAEYKKAQAERAGFAAVKDGEILEVLVFLLRLGAQETDTVRPRSHAFLDFLRSELPAPRPATESPRILTA